MKISLLLVGKTDIKYLQAGMALYEERINRYSDYKRIEIPELKSASSLSKSEIKEKEGDLIIKHIKPNDELVLLDIEGRSFSSEEFASFVEKRGVYGTKGLVFVVGGAYGFSDPVYARANFKISLSSMTFSHQIIRLIFLEQLYRAFTIIKGEPYHHG